MSPPFGTTAQSVLVEQVTAHSQATFIYESVHDDASERAILSTTEDCHDASSTGGVPSHLTSKVWRMETRAGAGAALAGYINTVTGPSTSSNTLSSLPVSAFLQPYTLQAMVPSLLSLANSPRPAYAIHVSSLSADENQLGEDIGSVLDTVSYLSQKHTAVLFSGSNPQDIVKYGTTVSNTLTSSGYDVIHVFDGLEGGRERLPLSSFDGVLTTEKASINARNDLEDVISQAIRRAKGENSQSDNGWFTYVGSPSAKQLLILPASSASAHAASLVPTSSETGVLLVHVFRPWSPERLAEVLPSDVEVAHVYAQSGSDALVESVLLATLDLKRNIRVVPFIVPKSTRWNAHDWHDHVNAAVAKANGPPSIPNSPQIKSAVKAAIVPQASKLCVIWGTDDPSQGGQLPANLANTFSSTDDSVEARVHIEYDNFTQGGLQQSFVLLSKKGQSTIPTMVLGSAGKADLVVIQSPGQVLASYAPLSVNHVSPSTQVLFASLGWTPEEYDMKLDATTKRTLWEVYGAHSKATGGVWTVDVRTVAAEISVPQEKVTEVAVWLLYMGAAASSTAEVARILSNTGAFNGPIENLIDRVKASLTPVDVLEEWKHSEMSVQSNGASKPGDKDTHSTVDKFSKGSPQAGDREAELNETRPNRLIANAVAPNKYKVFSEPPSDALPWHDAAKKIMYPEAFATSVNGECRPDLPEDNYILEVTENRRLTPLEYDRNVFHLELSTAGTGLKYAVGEALGVHGWNDEEDVNAFLAWYGLDPNELVSIPSRLDPYGKTELRTVFQAFQQNLDIFGKPPKSFYEELSKVAQSKSEKDHLRFIASAEGSATFRKWSESDTVTYADVFKAFPSARFSLGDLVKQVELIKPRHYSIASSQNFVGDSVHLLIVTVDWKTPTGIMRYGQCTRYLAGLKKGAKVMVSVKPSVMKLPPLDTQPIIMAGLGTGAAPFRAFIQERAWQKAQGREVGPLVYYFGSRYRGKEYLYGEELEAYMQDGIVTHAGLAFSRDGPNKVYIQHKMNEDAKMLADMLTTSGVFYLCGPTWPVPDVYEALCSALEKNQGYSRAQAEEFLSNLKEEEKYVLEVY